jgi:hypothetical protein
MTSAQPVMVEKQHWEASLDRNRSASCGVKISVALSVAELPSAHVSVTTHLDLRVISIFCQKSSFLYLATTLQLFFN